ncbi:hypothetical protein DyAD56_21230 [Dyella sp. AD56]|uniref:abortive infection family protein n=1 Tax=Dyella sp. AD56 TaxID=1528744 RepID=UPI000CAF9F81|nr:abortive infection family protein [Dyella sp. AD56]PMQ03249.1 hypothetical protein DyAD56_21230 [Dyella sp. AD56]
MIRLYQGSGSSEIVLGEPCLSPDAWARLKATAVRLLRARSRNIAAEFLETTPFELHEGSNFFNDEFSLLYYAAPLEAYVLLGERAANDALGSVCRGIAETMMELKQPVRFIAVDLHATSSPLPVCTPSLAITSDIVERSLSESEKAVVSSGGVAGVDRAHTALHGYLRAVCLEAGLTFAEDADITALFKQIWQQHPAMQDHGPRGDDVARVGKAMAAMLDALNPLRNRATLAHANDVLLPNAEAMLVINGIRTVLHYLNAKLSP